jgi:hypothetical protein
MRDIHDREESREISAFPLLFPIMDVPHHPASPLSRITRRPQITSVRFPGIHFLVVLRGECGIFNQIIAAHGDPS